MSHPGALIAPFVVVIHGKSLLRNQEDWKPLTVVLVTFCGVIFPFLFSLPAWAWVPYWIALLMLRSVVPIAQHYQAHLAIFCHSTLNFAYDTVLAQLTGYTTPGWELQHNRGHHRHFLEPAKDVAGTVDPSTGETVGLWRFVIRGCLRTMPDVLVIARGEADAGYWFRRLALHLGVQLLITALAFHRSPILAISFLVIPSLLMQALTWWASYWQHAGAPSTSIYSGAMTNLNTWNNRLTFNMGHHTAHHERPTLHWSRLPSRTRVILSRIPAACIRGEEVA